MASDEFVQELTGLDIPVEGVFFVRDVLDTIKQDHTVPSSVIYRYLDIPLTMDPSLICHVVAKSCYFILDIRDKYVEFKNNTKMIPIKVKFPADKLGAVDPAIEFILNRKLYTAKQQVEQVVDEIVKLTISGLTNQADQPPNVVEEYLEKAAARVLGKAVPVKPITLIMGEDESAPESIITTQENSAQIPELTIKQQNNHICFLYDKALTGLKDLCESGDVKLEEARGKLIIDAGDHLSMVEDFLIIRDATRIASVPPAGYIWKENLSPNAIKIRLEKYRSEGWTFKQYPSYSVKGMMLIGKRPPAGVEQITTAFPQVPSVQEYAISDERDLLPTFIFSEYNEAFWAQSRDRKYFSDGSQLIKKGNWLALKNVLYTVSMTKNRILMHSNYTQQFFRALKKDDGSKEYSVSFSNISLWLTAKEIYIWRGNDLTLQILMDGNIFLNGNSVFNPREFQTYSHEELAGKYGDITWINLPLQKQTIGTRVDGLEIVEDLNKKTFTLTFAEGFAISFPKRKEEQKFSINVGPLRVKLVAGKFDISINDISSFREVDNSYIYQLFKGGPSIVFNQDGSVLDSCNNSIKFKVSRENLTIEPSNESNSGADFIPKSNANLGKIIERASTGSGEISKVVPIFVIRTDGHGAEYIHDQVLVPYLKLAVNDKNSKLYQVALDGYLNFDISTKMPSINGLEVISFKKLQRLPILPLKYETKDAEIIKSIKAVKPHDVVHLKQIESMETIRKPDSSGSSRGRTRTGHSGKKHRRRRKLSDMMPPYFQSEQGKKFIHSMEMGAVADAVSSVPKEDEPQIVLDDEDTDSSDYISSDDDMGPPPDTQPLAELYPKLVPPKVHVQKYPYVEPVVVKHEYKRSNVATIDFLGNERQEKMELPPILRNDLVVKTEANSDYQKVEGNQKTTLKTIATASGLTKNTLKIYPLSLSLSKDHHEDTLSITNTGIEPIRFKLRHPSIIFTQYKVGPIAPGMTIKMAVKFKANMPILKPDVELAIVTEWQILCVPIKLSL